MKALPSSCADGEDFEQIGAAFELERKMTKEPLENGNICFMRQRDVVD